MPLGLPLPHTLGHEVAGEVIALGPDATGVKVGEHRAVYSWIGCGQCAACLRGEENYCNRRATSAARPARPAATPATCWSRTRATCWTMATTPPALAATYMCSGLTAYGAMKKVPPLGPKDDVLIIGAGGVGMMGIQFAKHLIGKGPLVADIDEGRLQAAMGAGAKAVYNTKDPEAIAQLMADTEGGVLGVGRLRGLGAHLRVRHPRGAARRPGGDRRPVRRRHGDADPDVPVPRPHHRRLLRRLAGRGRGDDGAGARRQDRPDPGAAKRR